MNSNDDKSIEQLRAEAAETRQRVSQDVEALAYKVSPENLKEEAKQSMKDAGHRAMDHVKEAGHRAVDNVKDSANEAVMATRGFTADLGRAARDNPIPTAMIGVGLGWLVYSAVGRRRSTTGIRYSRGYEANYGRDAGYPSSPGERVRGKVRDTAQRYQAQLSDMAEQGMDKTSAIARDVGHSAERRARQVADQATHVYDDNPLLIGALTLGAGLAVGAMLPHTPLEDEIVGQYRDKLFDNAKSGAHSAVEHGKSALVDAAADAAKQVMSQPSTTSRQQGAPDRSGQASPQNGF